MLWLTLLTLFTRADVACTFRAPGGFCHSGLIPVERWDGRDVTLELAGGPVRIACPGLGMATYLTLTADALSLSITDRADNVLAQQSGVPPLSVRAVDWFDHEIALSCVDGPARGDLRLPERVLFAVEVQTLGPPPEPTSLVPPREVRTQPPPRMRHAWTPRPVPPPSKPRVVRPLAKPTPRPNALPITPRRAPVVRPAPRATPAPVLPETEGDREAPAHDIY